MNRDEGATRTPDLGQGVVHDRRRVAAGAEKRAKALLLPGPSADIATEIALDIMFGKPARAVGGQVDPLLVNRRQGRAGQRIVEIEQVTAKPLWRLQRQAMALRIKSQKSVLQ